MNDNTTELLINKEHFLYNINHSFDLCQKQNIELALVTKSLCADPVLIELINNSSITTIADSRISNFAKMDCNKNKILIRPSTPYEALDVVKYSSTSIQTELSTIMALESASIKLNMTHNVILLVDLGDLRDGIMYTDTDQILEIAQFVSNSKFLNLVGIATNYNCFASLQPTYENMDILYNLHNFIKGLYNTDSPIISGGNSSSIPYLCNNLSPMPKYINQVRMGEVVLLGRNPSFNTFVDGFKCDVFTLSTTLMEVKVKTFLENGISKTMKRGIISLGQQDLQTNHIIPLDENISVLGACSDECVLNLDNTNYQVGDKILFNLEYGALMTAFASNFISRKYI